MLACLAQGRSNREIAAALSVTLATVKSHLVRIYAKLEATNRNEALGRGGCARFVDLTRSSCGFDLIDAASSSSPAPRMRLRSNDRASALRLDRICAWPSTLANRLLSPRPVR